MAVVAVPGQRAGIRVRPVASTCQPTSVAPTQDACQKLCSGMRKLHEFVWWLVERPAAGD